MRQVLEHRILTEKSRSSNKVVFFALLTLTQIAVTAAVDRLPVPIEKLRLAPAPMFPTAAPPAPRYPLYPYIMIPRPPRNPCAKMEGDVSKHSNFSKFFFITIEFIPKEAVLIHVSFLQRFRYLTFSI